MTQNSRLSQSSTLPLQDALRLLGERIQFARKRRRLTMDQMASRMFVTRKTVSRLEKDCASVSLSVLASALWVLGLEKQLLSIADPAQDKAGQFLEQQRIPQRVRTPGIEERLDF